MHSSFLHEHPEMALQFTNSERLEFLGDAILSFIVASRLFERFPERGEGELTALRSALVRTTMLAGFGRELDLGAFVRLSKGEEASGARNRDTLLADTFEAVIAALYLDQGMEAVWGVLDPFLDREIATIAAQGLAPDHKSRLQSRIQAERNITPRYQTIAVSGPDHRREFTVEVLVGEVSLGVGVGASKQSAAQAAAQVALAQLDALAGAS